MGTYRCTLEIYIRVRHTVAVNLFNCFGPGEDILETLEGAAERTLSNDVDSISLSNPIHPLRRRLLHVLKKLSAH